MDNRPRIRSAQSRKTDALRAVREYHAALAPLDMQKAKQNDRLTFVGAIERGLALRVARGVDPLKNLEQAFTQIRAEIGQPQLVLGDDCFLRKLDIYQSHLEDRVGELFLRNNTVGFSTYGEQFQGVHVNQTLVGIAIGTEAMETADA